jgi:hypothetical protein
MISRNDKGMAQIFKDLSHPLSFTLNQRAVGSTPTRPTKNNQPVRQVHPQPLREKSTQRRVRLLWMHGSSA